MYIHVKFTKLVRTRVLKFNKDIFSIRHQSEFESLTLSVFNYQFQNNPIYQAWCRSLKVKPEHVKRLNDIPFLPIELFRNHEVFCGEKHNQTVVFNSSSTTSQIPSRHFVQDIFLYESSFMKGFERVYGPVEDTVILALLPGYLERKGSSLVYMFDKLIHAAAPGSGFFLNNYEKIAELLAHLKGKGQKTLLIGVSYALMDLAELKVSPGELCTIMETGGMKGKRREMLKPELHNYLKTSFGVESIHSEYGMTELLSQAYSTGDELFDAPPWMRFLIRDVDDPLHIKTNGRTGGVNVIDLANVYSCSFIATQDLGRLHGSRLELMGRFDHSDVRGCNLMIE